MAADVADILIIEDDERIAELLVWFFERRAYRVRLASSFAQASQKLAERRPDLVLSDVRLGRLSASDELPRLAAAGLLAPTIVVSGYLDGELDAELRGIPGVVGTLRKPFELPLLEALVRQQLQLEPLE